MIQSLLLLAQYGSQSAEAGLMGGGSVGGGIGLGYWILFGGLTLLSLAISGVMKARFRAHSQHATRLSGAEVAERMLRQNGIRDVQVISVSGQLTDHYNPLKKTVNLSQAVYDQRNAAAAAVAAHEVGHAVQHNKGYAPLKMRSALVPVVSFGSNLAPLLVMVGLVLMALGTALGQWVAIAGLVGFAGATLFALITLPVEFDASHRALAWLDQSRVLDSVGHDRAKNALFWAAMTYVVGAIAALAQLVYWAMLVLGRRN